MPINVKCFNNYSNVMSCLLSCLFSHWGPTFSNISAHLSTIRGRNDADKARCQASLAGSKCSNPRNSFEQLGLSWTALSCFQRHSKAFQSPTWSELVLIALLSSVMLCQTCRWSLPWQCFWGQLSHAKAIAPLASPAHSKPMLNFCAGEVAASYIFSTYWCRLHILHHIATSCPKSLELSST